HYPGDVVLPRPVAVEVITRQGRVVTGEDLPRAPVDGAVGGGLPVLGPGDVQAGGGDPGRLPVLGTGLAGSGVDPDEHGHRREADYAAKRQGPVLERAGDRPRRIRDGPDRLLVDGEPGHREEERENKGKEELARAEQEHE